MERSWIRPLLLAASMTPLCVTAATKAAVFANFEDGTTDGVGYLSSSSGVKPFPSSPGPTATVITPASGTDTTQVLDIGASGFNGGQSGGNDVGFDFVASGLTSQFLSNDVLSFDWEVAPNASTTGYAQLYNIVLNAPGAGYTTIGGSSGATSALATTTGIVNQNPSFSGQVHTVSINYDAYKALISSSPGYIQLGISTNTGGGSGPASFDVYFDNFTLSTVPEPASLSLIGLAGAGLVGRRRRV